MVANNVIIQKSYFLVDFLDLIVYVLSVKDKLARQCIKYTAMIFIMAHATDVMILPEETM